MCTWTRVTGREDGTWGQIVRSTAQRNIYLAMQKKMLIAGQDNINLTEGGGTKETGVEKEEDL